MSARTGFWRWVVASYCELPPRARILLGGAMFLAGAALMAMTI